MQIQSFKPHIPTNLPVQAKEAPDSPPPAPEDKVSWSETRTGLNTIFIGSSLLPVIGAGTNVMAAWASAWNDADGNGSGVRPAIGLGGALANLAGTGVGLYGVFSGNHAASMAGLGLLGTSGLAAATVCLLTK